MLKPVHKYLYIHKDIHKVKKVDADEKEQSN